MLANFGLGIKTYTLLSLYVHGARHFRYLDKFVVFVSNRLCCYTILALQIKAPAQY